MRFPVYLDHAATTPLAPEVLEAMMPYFSDHPWNPSATYSGGHEARVAVEAARRQVAELVGASPDEIFFTSGGTEADNWALKAVPVPSTDEPPQVLISAIEHAAVLETAEALGRRGWEVVRIPVSGEGRVEPDDVEKRITFRTAVVAVMLANNEIGTLQPIAELSEICGERGVPLHVDAVQALGTMELDVRALGASTVALSAHKIYGPKGAGALYVRAGTALARWMDGGSHEHGMRAGTLNVPAIVGFGKACELVRERREADSERLRHLRDRLCRRVLERIPDVLVTAEAAERLPQFAHLCFRGVEGHAILTALDTAGIYASAGAACSAGSVATSHVLRAMGIPDEWARGAVRLTLGRTTTPDDVDYTVEVLATTVTELRGGAR